MVIDGQQWASSGPKEATVILIVPLRMVASG